MSSRQQRSGWCDILSEHPLKKTKWQPPVKFYQTSVDSLFVMIKLDTEVLSRSVNMLFVSVHNFSVVLYFSKSTCNVQNLILTV
jgi:hypothetical protein